MKRMDGWPVRGSIVGVVVLAALVAGCSAPTESLSQAQPAAHYHGAYPIRVVCTTAQIADMLTQIGGKHLEVTALMGPGVDPHLFKATPSDVKKLNGADLIFFNGMHLEGRLADLLVQLARRKPTFAVTEGLVARSDARLREPPEFEGHYDPHVWHDVSLWADCVTDTAKRLAEFDPVHAQDYQAGAQTYVGRLAELNQWCKSSLAKIPAKQRVLVTAHDAFGYFGAAYDVEVHGLQGISTADEADIAAIQEIVELLVNRKIKAVFVESSVQPRNVEALTEACAARGHQVVIGGELFSDALGDPGTPEAEYIGMIQHNVNAIVKALAPN